MSRMLAGLLLLLIPGLAWAQDAEQSAGVLDQLDQLFGQVFVGPLAKVLFFDLLFFWDGVELPLVVFWLVLGSVFFTLRMGFINIRGFSHAIAVTTGKYDKEDDAGEVTHFQALSSALSATVGLGNIAGVAIAVSVGGPGAILWMIIAGFFGMSAKFTECTLGQMYRKIDEHGVVSGGPMRYLDLGLAEMKQSALGKVLAVVFAVMCIGGSLGGGNMFQANQSYAAVKEIVPLLGYGDGLLYGIMLAGSVGLVILGGIKRIGAAASIIVPVMCGVYVLAAVYILLANAGKVPEAFSTIFSGAFSLEAGLGGLFGVLVQGFRRAAFSSEAGVGSASIAHSAASTEEPVREGIVALLEPFIDTIVVCTMTGLVVVITDAYRLEGVDGVLMTSRAFGSVIEWFPLVLSFAVVAFAFSTMISWSYYGERCVTYLFGDGASLPYKIVFLVFVVFGSVFKLGNVLDFSDLMILGMAFPNILGMFFLSGKVKARLDDYWSRYESGQMEPAAK
ncbi:MAG: alanine/glycine:cation symporter family protein [Myxococcota bacterium]